jgi:hypothetical protein
MIRLQNKIMKMNMVNTYLGFEIYILILDDITRTIMISTDEGKLDYIYPIEFEITSQSTRFLLLSKITLDDDIIQMQEDGVRALMYVFENVALPLIRTGVTFKNLRIQGKIVVFICIDDYTYQPLDEA